MPKKSLDPPISSHQSVVSLKRTGAEYERAISATPGLRIRVSAEGAKRWEFRYTAPDGSRRRMPLGPFPGLGFADAVNKARALKVDVVQDVDPVKERRAAKALARTGDTLDELAASWLAASAIGDHGGRKKRAKSPISIRNEESRFRVHIGPIFGQRRLLTITKSELKQFMQNFVAEQKLSPDTIASIGATLSGVFGYAVHKDLITSNPMTGLTRPLETRGRERLFDDEAIRKIWFALSRSCSPSVALATRFLMLTITRRADVGSCCWDEFNVTDATWTIPAVRHKSQLPFVVPLCPLALGLLAEAAKLQKGTKAKLTNMKTGFVFPSPRITGQAVSDYSLNQSIGRICEASKLAHGSAHDFRRSAATLLAERGGVDEVNIERVLAHTVGTKLSRVYNKHQYLPQKRQTLLVWEGTLSGILGGGDEAAKAA